MISAANCPSLRTEYQYRRGHPRQNARLPRQCDERGIVADLAPPAGKALARRPARFSRPPRLGPVRKRGSTGARTLLTLSVIFSWFGL